MGRIGTFWLAVVAVLTICHGARAQDSVGFRAPSNNIHCQFFAGDGGKDAGAVIRCDLVQTSNSPPPRPRDCDLEWGQAFEISGGSPVGYLLCYGDTVRDDRLPLLDYGNVIILEPQAGLMFVIAGLNTVYGEAGQVIPEGSPVGLMGGEDPEIGAILSTSGDDTGNERSETLYIEVRQGKDAVDPEIWFRTDKDG